MLGVLEAAMNMAAIQQQLLAQRELGFQGLGCKDQKTKYSEFKKFDNPIKQSEHTYKG